jgi:RIO-like serine/threonine protein kinase
MQQLIIERMADGGIKVSAPLQSNIHAVLADAMMGYEHCKYATTPPTLMQSS